MIEIEPIEVLRERIIKPGRSFRENELDMLKIHYHMSTGYVKDLHLSQILSHNALRSSIYDVATSLMMALVPGATDYSRNDRDCFAEALRLRLKHWDKRSSVGRDPLSKKFADLTKEIVETALAFYDETNSRDSQ